MSGMLQKTIAAMITLLGVILLVFSLFQFFGDPVKLSVGQSGDKKTTEQIRKELHLDEPRWKQLLIYLNDLSPFCIYDQNDINQKQPTGLFFGNQYKIGIKIPYLGMSYQTKRPVTQILIKALPGTIILAINAMLIACFMGMVMGILAAIFKDSIWDRLAIFVSTSGISTPSFFGALALAYLLGIALHSYTGLNFSGNWYEIDPSTAQHRLVLRNWFLPAVTLGIRPWAMITQLTRATILDVLNQDYIRTAKAKGLNPRSIIFHHALRNTYRPLITSISGWTGELLAGAFFVEYIFGWSGIGKLTIDALEKLDYPVLMGAILFSTVIFIIIQWFSDHSVKISKSSH